MCDYLAILILMTYISNFNAIGYAIIVYVF